MPAMAPSTVAVGTAKPTPRAKGMIGGGDADDATAGVDQGPPELPGLIGVSVWMRSVSGGWPCDTGSSRPRALTTPAVTVQLSP